MQKLAKRRKRQDYRVSKKKIATINSVQKWSITEKWVFVLLSIKWVKKILKFGNIAVNKKEFHKSK